MKTVEKSKLNKLCASWKATTQKEKSKGHLIWKKKVKVAKDKLRQRYYFFFHDQIFFNTHSLANGVANSSQPLCMLRLLA